MVSEVTALNKFNTPRVAQLSQRSNQFNLRTIRYTEDQLASIEKDHNYASFCFTLEDKFGDNGLIGVIILQQEDTRTLFIDSWFMSCRVLKRGMEDFMLNTIVDYAQKKGFERIIGEYLPTRKNEMVAHLYDKLGFTALTSTETKKYQLDVASYNLHKCHITTQSNGKN